MKRYGQAVFNLEIPLSDARYGFEFISFLSAAQKLHRLSSGQKSFMGSSVSGDAAKGNRL